MSGVNRTIDQPDDDVAASGGDSHQRCEHHLLKWVLRWVDGGRGCDRHSEHRTSKSVLDGQLGRWLSNGSIGWSPPCQNLVDFCSWPCCICQDCAAPLDALATAPW